MRDWFNEEKNKYLNTYTKPDSTNMLRITDFENEANLKKEIKYDI